MKEITCSQLAERYGVTRQAVYKMAKSGRIKCRVGERNVLFFDENVIVPLSWQHGEKGKIALYKYGGK